MVHGAGVEEAVSHGMYLVTRAAGLGSRNASYLLADWFDHETEGMPKDAAQAKHWYARAADGAVDDIEEHEKDLAAKRLKELTVDSSLPPHGLSKAQCDEILKLLKEKMVLGKDAKGELYGWRYEVVRHLQARTCTTLHVWDPREFASNAKLTHSDLRTLCFVYYRAWSADESLHRLGQRLQLGVRA